MIARRGQVGRNLVVRAFLLIPEALLGLAPMLFQSGQQPFLDVFGEGLALHALENLHCSLGAIKDNPAIGTLRQVGFNGNPDRFLQRPVEIIRHFLEKSLASDFTFGAHLFLGSLEARYEAAAAPAAAVI